jgi:hypothetical protein
MFWLAFAALMSLPVPVNVRLSDILGILRTPNSLPPVADVVGS